MNAPTPQTIFLRDYKPFGYVITSVHLTFTLSRQATRVRSRIGFAPNPATPERRFFLHGENLTLLSARIDGTPVTPEVTPAGLTCPAPDAPFVWEAEVEIAPQANTALEGLYMSNGMYCTQCEAEGFRKITYYPDRPDVMAVFTVRIEADLPVLLSNGNPVAQGAGWAEWHDPWPKPAYLFALVAGNLIAHPGRFTTMSGRDVALNIWVRPGDEGKCAFALDSLQRAMRWDEEVYGREYDLEIFNIVAVDDFNMGAMENKGLNIFNSSVVLASPETATDATYERIEAIIAHEYFHNWTGNRITCRDWFQLCLKEGLTVFRDQHFTSDTRSAAVKRIEDVKMLRARQFREDAGPLAHPVRPEAYVEINNFYTATVYEKGAEVIGMLRTLVGAEGYRKALDLYFERHDGQACTIEQFRQCFEDATGRDLSQFALWWAQSGTPTLHVSEAWDAGAGRYTLTMRQSTPPTPGQPTKAPMAIPVAVGLLGANGGELLPEGTRVLELTAQEASFSFDGLPGRPVPSLLRGFSAPVRLERETTDAERAFLMAHDSDPFNRWEAGHGYGVDVALRMLAGAAPDAAYLNALDVLAGDDSLDPAFRALALETPGEDELAREVFARGALADPQAIHATARALRKAAGERLGETLARLHAAMAVSGPYSPDAAAAGKRALRNRALALLAARGTAEDFARAAAQFDTAANMSEQAPALAALVHADAPQAARALAAFYDRWRDHPAVVDKWLTVQATAPVADAVARVAALTAHPAFDWLNPNKFRALIGGFAAGNPSRFHAADGSGYAFFADWLLKLDPRNPQTTARMAGAFETWAIYDEGRQTLIRAQLERIAATPGLSKDTADIVGRILG